MNWFDIYLAIGVAVTVWAYGSHQLDSPRRSRFVRDVEQAEAEIERKQRAKQSTWGPTAVSSM